MKKIFALLSILVIISINLYSQGRNDGSRTRPIKFFIGLQPTVEIEKIDEYRNTFAVNILPFQLEYAINKKLSARISPLVLMQFKPEFPAEISEVGAGLTIPYHFAIKNSEEGHRGFYAGPHAALSDHKLYNFKSVTGAVEIGYCFLFNSVLSFNIGVQQGITTKLNTNGAYARIENHTAAIFAFGIWF